MGSELCIRDSVVVVVVVVLVVVICLFVFVVSPLPDPTWQTLVAARGHAPSHLGSSGH